MISNYEHEFYKLAQDLLNFGETFEAESAQYNSNKVIRRANEVLAVDMSNGVPILKSNRILHDEAVDSAIKWIDTNISHFEAVLNTLDANRANVCMFKTCAYDSQYGHDIVISYNCNNEVINCTVMIESLSISRDLAETVYILYVVSRMLSKQLKIKIGNLTMLISDLYIDDNDVELFHQQINNYERLCMSDITSFDYDITHNHTAEDDKIVASIPSLQLEFTHENFYRTSVTDYQLDNYESYENINYTTSDMAEKISEAMEESNEREDSDNGEQ